jgi:cation:H+ antiporter
MIVHILLFIAGLAALYFGADRLVSGAAGIATRFGIPALVVGLTVVAFGTSTPELVVSITATVKGKGDIALGNIIGSNIFNIALILGLAAVIRPLHIHLRSITSEIPIMILAALLMLILSIDNLINRLDGLLFLAGIVAFVFFSYRNERRESSLISEKEVREFTKTASKNTSALFLTVSIVLGLTGLTLGAELLVRSSVAFAVFFGFSEKFIGLTIVAFGTSLPEFATSIIAAIRAEADISVGNIIGSNIFNILAILGLASLVQPISLGGGLVASGYIWDYLLMILLSCLLWLFMKTGMKITRIEGVCLIIVFFAYITWLMYSG